MRLTENKNLGFCITVHTEQFLLRTRQIAYQSAQEQMKSHKMIYGKEFVI